MYRCVPGSFAFAIYALVLGGMSACAGSSSVPPPAVSHAMAGSSARLVAGKYIKHVVIIIQENRSFDNIFAGFPNADAHTYGYMSNGTRVNLQPIPFEQRGIDHDFTTAVMDWDNGKMDKFDLNENPSGQRVGQFAYSHLERSQVAPYWTMAKRFVLADHMFPTMFGPSFTAHLTLIAGTADLNPTLSEANYPSSLPWGCDAPSGTTTETVDPARVVGAGGPFPCFTQLNTMATTLDAAGVSWKYYAPLISVYGGSEWSSFDAIKSVRYGSDWTAHVISPPQQILTDAANAKLARVSWVVPDRQWSDHPAVGTDYGPSWVASIVNAIGNSTAWKSTAIIVLWDDWGGWFDDAPPPQPDFRGLGIRVPCIIISPYVQPQVVHTPYEFGSILKFVEQVFQLPPLGSKAAGYTDSRATSIVNSFDFSIAPRAFKSISAPYPASFFVTHAPSLLPPDDE
jgi:phospholipase C